MIRDNLLTKTVALPAANATAATASLDLKSSQPGPMPALQVEIELPALPALVDTKKVTVNIQQSADDGGSDAWAVIPTTGTMVLTGAGGVGVAAKTWTFTLPRDVKRYIRAHVAVENGGGDNTAKSLTFALAA